MRVIQVNIRGTIQNEVISLRVAPYGVLKQIMAFNKPTQKENFQHSDLSTVEDQSSSEKFSIIIPTYNEKKTIQQTIDRCRRALHPLDIDIIVIDDDSPDRTWEFVQNTYTHTNDVRVIRRTEESGLGTAVIRGFNAAKGEYVAVIDADLQHPPEKLSDLFTAFDDGVDIVIGSRYVQDGGIENWAASRKLVSKGATLLSKAAVPSARGVSDPMSGFFAVRRDVIEGVELDPSGFKILLEVLARCEYERVVEVPYVFKERERGESNLDAAEYLNFVEHTLGLSVVDRGFDRFIAPDRFVRGIEFGLIGAIGTVVNTAIFLAVHQGMGIHYVFAGAVAFIAALNANFAGNWALTFNQPSERLVRKYLKFHATSIAGFVVYSGCLYLFLSMLSLSPLVGNVAAIAIGAVANFLGADEIAFTQL